MKAIHVLAATICLTQSACRTTDSGNEEPSAALAAGDDRCVQWDQVNLDRDIVEFQRHASAMDTCQAPVAGQPAAPTWRITVNGRRVCDNSLQLNDGQVELGGRWYTVFVWPAADEAVPDTLEGRYARLSELMHEYSKLVGTCLHKEPAGAGELDWVGGKRWDDWREIGTALSTKDSERWCRAVQRRLIETYVKPGSTYCQYGNCGEGGHVGACLSKRYGFEDSEIRLCSSRNDHMFAMVKDKSKPDGRWCILDRWDLIGHFSCDVDVDTNRHEIIHKVDGEWRTTGQNWFKKANCVTIDRYIASPDSLDDW